MNSPERVLSKMEPKYVTLEYCFILMSLYWMFSGSDFLILCWLQSKIDFVFSSPKWIHNLISTDQSQNELKLLFSADWILVMSLCWNIKQVSSAYGNSSQTTACEISLINKRKRSGPKTDPWGTPHRRFPGSEKVFLILNFLL